MTSSTLIWAYQIGSKTHPAHAYTGDPERLPICGVGIIFRWTKRLESASRKRLYPVRRCENCIRISQELKASK